MEKEQVVVEVKGRPFPCPRMTRRGIKIRDLPVYKLKRISEYFKYKNRIVENIYYSLYQKFGKVIQITSKKIMVDIKIYVSSQKRGDLDNYYKTVLDGLTYSKLIRDDKYVTKLSGEIITVKEGEEKIIFTVCW